jgi:dienelactone hydrolase
VLTRVCVVVSAAAIPVLSATTASAGAFPHFGAGCTRADFNSTFGPIRAERCGPSTGTAAVVVLHGCGGFNTFDHQLAADLPAYGITTLYVDYFEPTPPPGTRGYCSFHPRNPNLFPTWEHVVADAAGSLRPAFAHVGAVGWSLGGGLAIATAEDRHAFDAVAAFSALAGDAELAQVRSLPPTIFLSGGSHDIVPPEDARALFAAARRAGIAASLFVYPGGSHGWPGRQGDVGRARAARFLLRYLR